MFLRPHTLFIKGHSSIYLTFLLLFLLCCQLSPPFICFTLVAHYSKEKAFCIEKKKTIIFFIPLSNKYLFTAADSVKTHFWEPASPPQEAALGCDCVYVCVVCVTVCKGVWLLRGGKCVLEIWSNECS